jgi:hypothetical protein
MMKCSLRLDEPDGVDDWKAELALGEILGKTLVCRVVFRLQVLIVVPLR